MINLAISMSSVVTFSTTHITDVTECITVA